MGLPYCLNANIICYGIVCMQGASKLFLPVLISFAAWQITPKFRGLQQQVTTLMGPVGEKSEGNLIRQSWFRVFQEVS